MSDDAKKKMKGAAQDIDAGLNGLLGALGDAIGDMVTRLEEGNAGSVMRDHVFETDKGPIRAHAGVRLRMGGLDVGTPAAAPPKPVNPNRATSESSAPQATRSLEYDLFEDADAWIFTADLPGVGGNEVDLEEDGSVLHLKTTGTRLFEAQIDLEQAYDFEGIKRRVHNGVLTLNIPKSEVA